MKNAIILCSALTVALLGSAHQAQAQSKTWEDCINKTSTNYDWSNCGGEEIARQETRLNAAWKKAYACFDATDQTERNARQSFLEEQRLWIKWKDAACDFYHPTQPGDDTNGYAGREGQVISAHACTASIVSNRADWLENFVKDCR